MLSVVEISNRIKNPNLVAPSDLSTLQELSDKYPYAQLFSILYLKSLSKAGDPRFEEELRRHSFRISDRVQLYNLIQNHEDNQSISVSEKSEIIETATIVEEKRNETILEFQEEFESVIEEESEVIILVHAEEEEINSISTEETIEVEQIHIEANDNLEESILHHAFAANYRLDELTDEEIENLEVRAEKKEETKILPITEKADHKTSSFTTWLKSNNNYSEGDSEDKKAINAVVEDFSDFDPSSDLLFGEVEKPKTEFYSPAKKARKSLEENELPVSETLAKIYVMQGNYPQAISAYKQLSLSFPEKNIFFAHLIEDLEKKINK